MSKKSLVPIVLPADPTAALEAATKQYVDNVNSGNTIDWGTLGASGYVGGGYGYIPTVGGNIPFPSLKAGSGVTFAAGGGLQVAKSGTYVMSAAITTQNSSAAAHYVTMEFQVKRGGSTIFTSPVVSNTFAAGAHYGVTALNDIVPMVAGDQVFIYCTTSAPANGVNLESRSHFTIHRLSGPGPAGPAGPSGIPVDVTWDDMASGIAPGGGAVGTETAVIAPIAPFTGTCYGYRYGKAVTLNLGFTAGSAVGAGVAFATVPASMRPGMRLYLWAIDAAAATAVSVYVDTNGALYHLFARSSGTGTLGAITYVMP